MLLNIMFATSVICLRYVCVIVYALFFVSSFYLVWWWLFNNKHIYLSQKKKTVVFHTPDFNGPQSDQDLVERKSDNLCFAFR